jgi:hypothetical protein
VAEPSAFLTHVFSRERFARSANPSWKKMVAEKEGS